MSTSPRPTVRIRAAQADDAGLILKFVRELAQFERLLDQVHATEELMRDALFGSRPYAEALIAELDGQPAGFALFFHNFSTFLARPGIYLEDLYVQERARGNGVGIALLEYIAKLAVERKCERVDWSVLDWNSRAINFYERLGARPESEWQVYRLTGDALKALARQGARGS